jgi:putative DNA primase/helicase
MTAAEIAHALRGTRNGDGYLCHCPVPGHGKGRGDRSSSQSISDGNSALLVHCHAGCAAHDVLAELRRRGLLQASPIGEASRRHEVPFFNHRKVAPPATDRAAYGDSALRIWHDATDPRGTTVEAYLRSRGLDLPDDVVGEVLRFHPRLKVEDGFTGGMIALFRDIRSDAPCGIHRTFLSAEGKKLGRKMLGRAAGAAIKLDADENVTAGLAIGEGVETCLAGRQLGFRPTWALGSVGAIAKFPVLAGVECLTIFAEIDAGASAQAVDECGRRWRDAGREVLIVTPRFGDDLNDTLGVP